MELRPGAVSAGGWRPSGNGISYPRITETWPPTLFLEMGFYSRGARAEHKAEPCARASSPFRKWWLTPHPDVAALLSSVPGQPADPNRNSLGGMDLSARPP